MRLTRGALVTHEQAGGGGYGDPAARDPQRVEADIQDEKISAEFARKYFNR